MVARSTTCRAGRCFSLPSALLLTLIIRLAVAAPCSDSADTSTTGTTFDAATVAATGEQASHVGVPGDRPADGGGHAWAPLADQKLQATNASDGAVLNSTGRVQVRHKRTHHGHHLHHHHWMTGHHHGAAEPGPAQQFDNVLFRTVGALDANTCLSRFVCEIVARRGAQSFIGTTIGSLFKGFAHAPPTTPAHALFRAAAIGKHGWLPVCSNAYPQCTSHLSTALSVLNLFG